MKTLSMIAVTVGLMAPMAAPAFAQNNKPRYFETGGKTYTSLRECQRAKKRAKDSATVAGAAIAGVGTALLGGNIAETALVAGGGALLGREIAKHSVKQC